MNRREFLASASLIAIGNFGNFDVGARAQENPGRGPMRAGPPPSPIVTGTRASLPIIEAPLPAVEVEMAGARYVFGLDTGAQGFARLSQHLVLTEGIEATGRMRVSDPSGLGPEEVEVFSVPSLALGDLIFENVEAQAARMLPAGIDGILGIDLFSGLILTFDRRTDRLLVTQGELQAADDITTFQSPPGPTVRVPIVIAGETLVADIDTGQSIAPLLLSATVASKIADAATTTTGQTVSRAMSISLSPFSGSVTVGSVHLSVESIGWPAPTPAPNLGWQAFRNHVLRIDRTHNRVAIT